jgi:hypothetical protein
MFSVYKVAEGKYSGSQIWDIVLYVKLTREDEDVVWHPCGQSHHVTCLAVQTFLAARCGHLRTPTYMIA